MWLVGLLVVMFTIEYIAYMAVDVPDLTLIIVNTLKIMSTLFPSVTMF